MNQNIGIFEGSVDIGKTLKGSTVYDPAAGTYTVTGGGADMWGDEDDFRMAWLKVSGDVTLTADVEVVKARVIPNTKAVLMIRQNLDPAPPYADIAIHADGHITLQFRRTQGGQTEDVLLPKPNSRRFRIERKGDQFTVFAGATDGSKLTASKPVKIVLNDPVYVGLGMCSHQADGLATAVFSNVSVEPKPQK